jgi:hypothetical protein
LRLDGAGFDRLHFFDHFLDVIGRCTTAAAYDIYHSIEGEVFYQVSHFVRIWSYSPFLTGQSGIGIYGDKAICDIGQFLDVSIISFAPKAQLRPMDKGACG